MLYQLIRIQILDYKKYSSLAFSQQFKKLDIPTRRGLIFDRNGVKLAESIQTNSVFADPFLIKDKKRTSQVISNVLQLDSARVLNLLNKKKRFVWIRRRITDKQADAIRELNLKGIGFRHENKRVYPYGKLCSHVLGFTDVDENGLEGVENSLNHILSGNKGYKVIETDGRQRQFSTLDEETVSARYGNSVFLTIDCEIQSIVEDELEDACLKWRANSATAIVIDPSTGEVLAMANYPAFDPNFVQNSKPHERRNRVITDCFEPGSLIKPIIVCGALDGGLVKENEMFFCHNGNYRVRKRVIRDVHPYNYLTVSEIVINSSNIGMAQLGMLMERKRLYNHLKNFSFGEKTGIQLPGEARGIVRPLRLWSTDSAISVAFGYETAVTPMQLSTAFCSIANGGMLLKPQIIHAITDYSGKRVKKKFGTAERIRRVITPKVSREIMTPILENVIKEGTGKRAGLLAYRIAGKTGTAKKLRRVGGRMEYSNNKYVSSFVGYAPVNDPRICVLVSLNEPKNGAYYGGTVAAPAVRNIIERALHYMRVESQHVQVAQK
ncbi:MAG: putative glycosyltransferase [Candidatus Scalindua rubra]|uniref:Putative glycosyltransferase n=1 Tax=Candidatus Scalindua rubra TaxID=1872076 RepID=A0A1E3XCQ3_9BACT|nr:MAG: putative glycosyltransferase [Candidatus Scalindua rubra]